MGKNLQLYFDAIGQRESGGDYGIKNDWGYLGKYQMGESALVDAGYYIKSLPDYNNDWTGKFTGKDKIYSVDDFLNNPEAQEHAMYLFTQKQWGYIKGFAPQYTGKYIKGTHITYSGMLSAAHLKGHGGLKEYLKSGGKIDPSDGLGTKVGEYLKLFADYDVSEITGLPDDSDGSHLVEEDKNTNNKKEKIIFPTKTKALPKYFDTEKVINKNQKDLGSKIKGTDTGLAADLFSEEEIEELKKRLEHERLPKETLEKMGEYHKRKFFERLKAETTYDGDGSDLTLANFVDKDGDFTLSPQKITPPKPQPPIRNSNTTKTKDLSKDEKWQSFRKIFRTFFAMPDDNGKPMGKINSVDVYNAIDVMETMKKAMHESEVTQIPEPKDEIKESMQFEFLSDEAQTEMMQSALSQTSEQIKTDVKTEILNEISRQTMFPDREHVENIMRDVFDDVIYRRGYEKSN